MVREVRKWSVIHRYTYAWYKDSYRAAGRHPSLIYSLYRVHATREAVHLYVQVPVIHPLLRG